MARKLSVAVRVPVAIVGVVVIARGEDPLLAHLIQTAIVVQDIQRPLKLVLQSLATGHVTRVAQVSAGIERFLHTEQPVVLSRQVPTLGLLGQITAMANRGHMVVIVKLNGEPASNVQKKKDRCEYLCFR